MPLPTTKSAAAKGSASKPHGFVPKRGRPSREQVAAIERSILHVSLQMFLSSGYGDTSMDAVAAGAGVSKGTLYSRYPTKADLFKAIVADRLATWRAESEHATKIESLDIGDTGPARYLVTLGVAILKQMEQPEIADFRQLVLAEAPRFPELAEEIFHQGYWAEVKRLARELDKLGAGESWPLSDAEGVASTFNSALVGWSQSHAQLPSSPEARLAFVTRLVAIMFGGRAVW